MGTQQRALNWPLRPLPAHSSSLAAPTASRPRSPPAAAPIHPTPATAPCPTARARLLSLLAATPSCTVRSCPGVHPRPAAPHPAAELARGRARSPHPRPVPDPCREARPEVCLIPNKRLGPDPCLGPRCAPTPAPTPTHVVPRCTGRPRAVSFLIIAREGKAPGMSVIVSFMSLMAIELCL